MSTMFFLLHLLDYANLSDSYPLAFSVCVLGIQFLAEAENS